MAKIGRPSKYSQEITDHIVSEMAKGRSLSSIIEHDDGMPSFPTVFAWMDKHEEFLKQYTRARELQAHRMAEEIFEIADDSSKDTKWEEGRDGEAYEVCNHEWLNRSRLRVDTRKWMLSKVLPKLYGEKVTQELTGKDGAPLSVVVNIVPSKDK